MMSTSYASNTAARARLIEELRAFLANRDLRDTMMPSTFLYAAMLAEVVGGPEVDDYINDVLSQEPF
jgi:hypothetical protein